ncbi:hypothetical protein [Phenylobacterium sp.]|uniref:hypothetical protein n=1 Tax=Phenylobacterium sp. TaxID=1871053 RepID=UPI0030F43841
MEQQLWLVEGLPGSGKTTTARLLAEAANAQGRPARWWLEEARDHPVLPSALRKTAAQSGFVDDVLRSFEAFLRRENGVLILEGAAFQNTVRFLYANDAPRDQIATHVRAWSGIVAHAKPRFLLLGIDDPRAHYMDFVATRRGEAWMTKLIAYVEQTPLAQARGWTGMNGLVLFWTEYRDLCGDLFASLPFPKLQVAATPAWAEGLSAEVGSFFGI